VRGRSRELSVDALGGGLTGGCAMIAGVGVQLDVDLRPGGCDPLDRGDLGATV